MRLITLLEGWADILGVDSNASEAQKKAAFRRLALKWHPDKNPGNEDAAEARFKEAQAAYEESMGNRRAYVAQDWQREWEQNREARRQEWERRYQEAEARRKREEQEREVAFKNLMSELGGLLKERGFLLQKSAYGGYYIFGSNAFIESLGIKLDEPGYFDRLGDIDRWIDSVTVKLSGGGKKKFKLAEVSAADIAEMISSKRLRLSALLANFKRLPWNLLHSVSLAVMAMKSGFQVNAVHGFYAQEQDDPWGTLGKHPFEGAHPRTWLVIDGTQVDYHDNEIKFPGEDPRYRHTSTSALDENELDNMFYKQMKKD